MRNYPIITLLTLLISIGGCAYIPFSGGKLTGTPTEALTDWREIARVSIIQLETNPEQPYSVNIWMIAEQARIYVFAGDNYAQWVHNIESNQSVRLQAEEKVYDLRAYRVTDPDEYLSFTHAWNEKYESDRTDSDAQENYLFRLE